MPDDSSSSPVVAANVDIVVVANALDHPFSARSLERFLLVAWESGATPLVVLTKADACADVSGAMAEAEAAALGAPLLVLSVRTALGSTSCACGSPARRQCCSGAREPVRARS
jgi:ribosome biogenesis GTPase